MLIVQSVINNYALCVGLKIRGVREWPVRRIGSDFLDSFLPVRQAGCIVFLTCLRRNGYVQAGQEEK